jgi:hypothetical protein
MCGALHRFNSDRDFNVKYSTLCPSRICSPSAANLAIPTNWPERDPDDETVASAGSNKGKCVIGARVGKARPTEIRFFFA